MVTRRFPQCRPLTKIGEAISVRILAPEKGRKVCAIKGSVFRALRKLMGSLKIRLCRLVTKSLSGSPVLIEQSRV